MSKYSLQYRSARRRAFASRMLSEKPASSTNQPSSSLSPGGWQSATYVGFNTESGLHRVRVLSGETSEATRIPGYGAEYGGVSMGSRGLLSSGFWSN